MPKKGESQLDKLRAWLAEHQPEKIGGAEYAALEQALAPISSGRLRHLLRQVHVPVHPAVEGVVQDDFESLERTLRALEAEYMSGDRDRARHARACVLTAKQHARWALRRLGPEPARAAAKQEMLLWMNTWLENPALFPAWVTLRKRCPACLPDPERYT